MNDITSSCPPASPEREGRSPNRAGEAGGAKKHFFPKRKTEAVLRILRGESLEIVSRELGITAAQLSSWRKTFLDAGLRGFATKKDDAKEEETKRLNAKIGEQAMKIELLEEKIAIIEQKSPLARRRSRK